MEINLFWGLMILTFLIIFVLIIFLIYFIFFKKEKEVENISLEVNNYVKDLDIGI
jgi:hypothetical protein